MASDRHTPFGIPAQIRKDIKIRKRKEIDESLGRSREEFHDYLEFANTSLADTN